MKKPFLQGTLTVLFFFGMYYSLMQFDWLTILKIDQMTNETDQKLGELFWEVFKKSDVEINDAHVVNSIDTIASKICDKNDLNREDLKIHILKNDEINAFALPNGYLLIYSGLILNSENEEALAGVIGHEIAHIELNHVMKKLVKEIGLSVLISMTTGNGGTEVIKETAKMLSSTAFDRQLEKEADIQAVEFLLNAKINPEPFANFLYSLSYNDPEAIKHFTWLNTHPDSKERAEYIIDYSKDKVLEFESILSNETWNSLKEVLRAQE